MKTRIVIEFDTTRADLDGEHGDQVSASLEAVRREIGYFGTTEGDLYWGVGDHVVGYWKMDELESDQ